MKKSKNDNLKYLVANENDRSWGLYVTTIGHQSIKPNSDYPPKGHPSSYWFSPDKGKILHEYQLLYVTKGEGTFASRSWKSVKVGAGFIIVLFPGEWHTYKPSRKHGWDEYWIGFNGATIDGLIRNEFFTADNPVLNVGFNEQLVALFNQGIEFARFQRTAYQQALSGIANLMLSLIFFSQKNKSFGDKDIIYQIDKARMMMRDDSQRDLSPELIAKSLNMSYSWFRRIFKQYTGLSPAQYQMQIKVQKCKELLTSTTMPVKEIGFDLNFESTSYFVTFFKTKTGLSPTQYRNKVHGDKLKENR